MTKNRLLHNVGAVCGGILILFGVLTVAYSIFGFVTTMIERTATLLVLGYFVAGVATTALGVLVILVIENNKMIDKLYVKTIKISNDVKKINK